MSLSLEAQREVWNNPNPSTTLGPARLQEAENFVLWEVMASGLNDKQVGDLLNVSWL